MENINLDGQTDRRTDRRIDRRIRQTHRQNDQTDAQTVGSDRRTDRQKYVVHIELNITRLTSVVSTCLDTSVAMFGVMVAGRPLHVTCNKE